MNPAHGIAIGVVAAGVTAYVTSDRGVDGGAASGVVLPAAIGGITLGAAAFSSASAAAWRWPGSPALASASRSALGPLACATVGAAAGLGAALLFDAIWPAKDGHDPSPDRVRQLETHIDASRERQADIERLAAESRQRRADADAAREQERIAQEARVDDALGDTGRFGEPGTIGEGRIDVTGMSPEAAAQFVVERYGGADDDGVTMPSIRVDGGNVFSIDPLLGDYTSSTESVESFFADKVDVHEPFGTITADEARSWQAGPYGEVRTEGVGGGA